jgi:hypothetical protein
MSCTPARSINSAITDHMTLAELVPCYTSLPAPFTKRRAVQVIVWYKLRQEGFHRRSMRGKGNRAARRIDAMRGVKRKVFSS